MSQLKRCGTRSSFGYGLAGLVALLVFSAGCAGGSHLYDVHPKSAAPVLNESVGVPFLPIVSVDIEKVTFVQSWVQISVTGTFEVKPQDGKAAASKTDKQSSSGFNKTVTVYTSDLSSQSLDTFKDVYSAFLKSGNSADAWDTSFTLISMVNSNKLFLEPPNLVTNTDQILAFQKVSEDHSRTQVPASSPLYFNVNIPTGGSSTAEIDLAPNGTMTKASGGKTDALPATITTGVGSLASTAFGAIGGIITAVNGVVSAPAKQNGAGTATVLSVNFEVTQMGRFYTIIITHPSSIHVSSCGPVSSMLSGFTSTSTISGSDVNACRASLSVETKVFK
jgi:hypothetical protein